MSENDLLGEKKDNIFHITLNRPEKRNALPFEMLADISQLVEDQIFDPDIRAIIIKGEGAVFSSGVDFNSLGSLAGRYMGDASAGGAPFRSDVHKFQHYLNRLEAIEIPIICVFHGAIFGMAMELALACDFRLMSDDCKWGMPELKFGLVADLGGTSRLHRTIGASRAMEVLMTGKTFTAQQALEWGLVSYLYPEGELLKQAEQLALDISRMGPLAVGATKKIIRRGEGVDLMTQLDMEVNLNSILLRSRDFQEGITALLEKRDPQWKRQ
jgi:enoyl-CoA hydratase/carnithine racemase